jgi:hypothetical protein
VQFRRQDEARQALLLPPRFQRICEDKSYSSDQYPDRVDIKHGRTMVVLPPSTGKVMEVCEIGTIDDLVQSISIR